MYEDKIFINNLHNSLKSTTFAPSNVNGDLYKYKLTL